MNENEIGYFLFGTASLLSIVYAIYHHVRFLLNKNKFNYINATVVDITTSVPETMKINNSKWAIVRFYVDGKEFTSSNRIQVSMNTTVGDKVEVAYFIDAPSNILKPESKKENMFLVIGILSLLIALYLKS